MPKVNVKMVFEVKIVKKLKKIQKNLDIFIQNYQNYEFSDVLVYRNEILNISVEENTQNWLARSVE